MRMWERVKRMDLLRDLLSLHSSAPFTSADDRRERIERETGSEREARQVAEVRDEKRGEEENAARDGRQVYRVCRGDIFLYVSRFLQLNKKKEGVLSKKEREKERGV